MITMGNKKYTTKLTTSDILNIQLSILDSAYRDKKQDHQATARSKMRIYDMFEDMLKN